MLISAEPCINCGAKKLSDRAEYEGCLGYEATICKRCGFVYDHVGIHPPDKEDKSMRLQPKLTDILQSMYETFSTKTQYKGLSCMRLAREVLKQCGRIS